MPGIVRPGTGVGEWRQDGFGLDLVAAAEWAGPDEGAGGGLVEGPADVVTAPVPKTDGVTALRVRLPLPAPRKKSRDVDSAAATTAEAATAEAAAKTSSTKTATAAAKPAAPAARTTTRASTTAETAG